MGVIIFHLNSNSLPGVNGDVVAAHHRDTKCPPVFGLPSSCSTVLRFVLCWLPQEGVDTVGVWRSPELVDEEEEVVMFTMIGVRMFDPLPTRRLDGRFGF